MTTITTLKEKSNHENIEQHKKTRLYILKIVNNDHIQHFLKT